MRARSPSMRVVTTLGASLLLLVAVTGGTVAARTELFTIEIDLDTDPAVETFLSSSPLLCESGTATTFFDHFGGSDRGRAGSFHLTKLIECDDGSGSFLIRVNAGANFVVGDGTTGGWSIVPGSGTGDYTGLTGGGSVVGVNVDEPSVDLVDHYYGSLSR